MVVILFLWVIWFGYSNLLCANKLGRTTQRQQWQQQMLNHRMKKRAEVQTKTYILTAPNQIRCNWKATMTKSDVRASIIPKRHMWNTIIFNSNRISPSACCSLHAKHMIYPTNQLYMTVHGKIVGSASSISQCVVSTRSTQSCPIRTCVTKIYDNTLGVACC